MQIFFLLPWRRMLLAFYRETALLSLEGRREGGEEAREGLGSQGSRLELQESLRESRCQKIFPKLLSKDKRTNSTGRLLPGKYTGLERVNVFSPPSVKWPSNKSTFNCIYSNCVVTGRVVHIAVASVSFRGPCIIYANLKTRRHA